VAWFVTAVHNESIENALPFRNRTRIDHFAAGKLVSNFGTSQTDFSVTQSLRKSVKLCSIEELRHHRTMPRTANECTPAMQIERDSQPLDCYESGSRS
jgi:hypothetical protein